MTPRKNARISTHVRLLAGQIQNTCMKPVCSAVMREACFDLSVPHVSDTPPLFLYWLTAQTLEATIGGKQALRKDLFVTWAAVTEKI